MKIPLSAIHMPIAIAKIILALFQMAILREESLSTLLLENDHNAWDTHIRSTINSEEAI